MRTRLPSFLLALMATASVVGVFLGTTPLAMKAAIAAMVALAIWRSGDGLVAVAAFAPLGGGLAALTASSRSWTLPLVCAFLAGVAIRESIQPQPSRDRTAALVAAIWIAIVLLSVALGISAQRPPGQSLTIFLGDFLTWLVRKFPMTALADYPGVGPAALAGASAVLFAVTATLCGRDPLLASRIVRALLVSGAAVGALNVNRLIEAAARRPPLWSSLVELHHSIRISALFPDFNAAGAFFLLLLPVGFSLLIERRQRWLAAITLPFLLAGIWLAGSRTSLVMLPLALIALVVWRMRSARNVVGHSRRALALVAGVIGASLLVVAVYPRAGAHGSFSGAVEARQDLVTTTLRMVRTAPLLGVGIGNYYARSPQFMPPRLRQYYRAQNAHNQFLQVLGELGFPGLLAFVALVGAGIAPALKALVRHTGDPLMAGTATATLAFLLVSLGMHPLLISEVAVTLHLMFGLTRALGIASISAPNDPIRRA